MRRKKPTPFTIFYQQDGQPVHYDPIAMQFTEISDQHLAVLNNCLKDVPIPAELNDSMEELIEAGLLVEDYQSLPYNCHSGFTPNVVAFRIALTEKCNLKCAECFVTKNADRLNEMSLSTLEQVTDKIVSCGSDRNIMIHFFGGEPLIRFDYIKYVVTELESAYSAGSILKPSYSITTNATLVDAEKAQFFAEHHFKVAVSIDGDRTLHNILRPDASGTGSYESSKAGYELMVRTGLKPSIIITPHPDHIDDLRAKIKDIISDFNPKVITANVPFDYETLAWSADGKELAELLIYITGVCLKKGIKFNSALSPIMAALSNRVSRNSPCSMLCDDIMVSIRTDGKMSFCSQKWHDKMVQDIPDKGEPIKVPLNLTEKCHKCFAYTICGGPCPAYQIISGKNIDHNKCTFMHSILEKITEHLDWFEES